ncbi:MAG: HAD family phosphatase, partial [Acetatifactor sp.]|nr:HAD family phosphatase [Acetatifactor sp.]
MRAVVFDMDGVLFDTERVCMDSWVAVAEKEGLPDMETIFPRCIGGNANDSREIVLEAYGQDFDYDTFRKKAFDRFWEYIEKNGLPMMAGVREILAWLKEEQWIVGLASSTRKSSVLDHL